jgi:hypothetical protein
MNKDHDDSGDSYLSTIMFAGSNNLVVEIDLPTEIVRETPISRLDVTGKIPLEFRLTTGKVTRGC